MRSKQVAKQHYDDSHYDTESRFVGYYIQKELILKTRANAKSSTPFTLLEIGPGNGLITDYAKKAGVSVTTLDIAEDLHPDIVGDITNLTKYTSKKYSAICCFEVLEHLPYENLENIIAGFHAVTSKYLIISIPRVRLYLSLWTKLSRLTSKSIYLSFPFPKKHIFDGQHYWELGAKGYSEKNLKRIFSEKFKLIERLVNPLDPYHIYFIWEKL